MRCERCGAHCQERAALSDKAYWECLNCREVYFRDAENDIDPMGILIVAIVLGAILVLVLL